MLWQLAAAASCRVRLVNGSLEDGSLFKQFAFAESIDAQLVRIDQIRTSSQN